VRIQKIEIAFIYYLSCKTKEKIITSQEIFACRINKEIMKRKQNLLEITKSKLMKNIILGSHAAESRFTIQL
jgi:hypothetical protein